MKKEIEMAERGELDSKLLYLLDERSVTLNSTIHVLLLSYTCISYNIVTIATLLRSLTVYQVNQ